VTYSIDFQGPTAGAVLEGDILTPTAPGLVPPPTVDVPPVVVPPTMLVPHAQPWPGGEA
jgi:hypothetical protein